MDTQQFDAPIDSFGKAGRNIGGSAGKCEKGSASGAVAKDVWRHLY